jgi:hypothetical protein
LNVLAFYLFALRKDWVPEEEGTKRFTKALYLLSLAALVAAALFNPEPVKELLMSFELVADPLV